MHATTIYSSQETNMATITKIVRNIHGDMELIQQIVPDGWGVRVVHQPKSPYAIWRRTPLPNKASTWRSEEVGNVARILDLWRDPANFFSLFKKYSWRYVDIIFTP